MRAPLTWALLRFARSRPYGSGAAILLGAMAALLSRHEGASHAFSSIVGPLAFPLLALTIATSVVGRSLPRAASPLLLFGATREQAALAHAIVAAGVSSVLGALLGAAVAAIAHAPGEGPYANDVLVSGEVGATAGLAYGALFAAFSFGDSGSGRGVVFLLDALLGAGHGPLAFLTPHAHVRALLGGNAPLRVSSWTDFAMLLGLAAFWLGVVRLRARRIRLKQSPF